MAKKNMIKFKSFDEASNAVRLDLDEQTIQNGKLYINNEGEYFVASNIQRLNNDHNNQWNSVATLRLVIAKKRIDESGIMNNVTLFRLEYGTTFN